MSRSLGLVLGVLALVACALVPATAAADATAPPAPTCAEGPQRQGNEIVGTPCADRIAVPPSVAYVDGGAGNDVIVEEPARSAAVASVLTCPSAHCGVGSQTFEGGPGDDIVYGDRGNDILRGNEGDDRLYGGIGDDRLEGGPGNDWLSGGFGGDRIDGGEGNDYVRGDGTIDYITDTGGGYDTLSFATGVTPGFGAGIATGVPGFPAGSEGERGVYLNLGAGGKDADNGIAASGGGVDEVQPGVFERIVGTPFSDYIVGTAASEEIIGDGGADVIRGGGGADVLGGGADGDYLEAAAESTMYGESGAEGKFDYCTGGGAAVGCASKVAAVQVRDPNLVSVGETRDISGSTQVYLVGSSGADVITASYAGGAVNLRLGPGSTFDQTQADEDEGPGGGCTVTAATASCPLVAPPTPNVPPLDSILLAGMGGNDAIVAEGFPDGSSVVAIGGAGADTITGGASEDVLVDGPGASADNLFGQAGDDALVHNAGPDLLEGGEGSDLFFSFGICEGERIEGGPSAPGDRDNASWAKFTEGVDARLDQGRAGRIGAGGEPVCTTGPFDGISGIEDLEGSNQSDFLVGDAGENQLLGHKGEDSFYSLAGNDLILANSGSRDAVINCGADTDQAVIDFAPIGDPTPIECERVREGAAEEFVEEIAAPFPPPVVTPPPAPPADTKPPRTSLAKRPRKLVLARAHLVKVTFRFAASERGSTFRCRLDRKPFKPCRSPRTYRVAAGAHVFRVYAIDAAGNRDLTPASFAFRVKRAGKHRHRR